MPLQKLEFRPGINKESTSYANEGGYYSPSEYVVQMRPMISSQWPPKLPWLTGR